jgi:hypothetical protein
MELQLATGLQKSLPFFYGKMSLLTVILCGKLHTIKTKLPMEVSNE